MRMAYIEDDTDTLELMGGVLRNYGIKVHPFFSTALFHNSKIDGLDLILTDGTLQNGESALDVITTQRMYYPETPLWLYSGNYDMVSIFHRAGFNAYEKSRDMNRLLNDLKAFNNR